MLLRRLGAKSRAAQGLDDAFARATSSPAVGLSRGSKSLASSFVGSIREFKMASKRVRDDDAGDARGKLSRKDGSGGGAGGPPLSAENGAATAVPKSPTENEIVVYWGSGSPPGKEGRPRSKGLGTCCFTCLVDCPSHATAPPDLLTCAVTCDAYFPAWRCTSCLIEKKIPHRSELVSFERWVAHRSSWVRASHWCRLRVRSGVLKTAPFRALNPRSLVPILTDGDVRIYESLAILDYLEHFYTDVPLLPKDKPQRAVALTRVQEANNLSVVAGEVIYYVRRTPPEDINHEYLAVKRQTMLDEVAVR